MNDDTNDEEVIEEPIIDATDLVVGEIIVDDEDYDEIIVLDLRKPESHDCWLV